MVERKTGFSLRLCSDSRSPLASLTRTIGTALARSCAGRKKSWPRTLGR